MSIITIKNKHSLDKMRIAGQLLSEVLRDVEALISPGVSTLALDAWIAEQLESKGLRAVCKGYAGYQHVSCISINDEVVHGVPRTTKILCEGDLVKIDVCAAWKDYCADMARCFFVGKAESSSRAVADLVATAASALNKGIQQARAGNRVSDISAAIQQEVEARGYGVVRDFAGHGIGKKMHEAPEILNYGKPGEGPVLKVGMALAIEPMITLGDFKVYIADDGWTVRTVDKSIAAHVEDTVIILEDGPCVITRNNQKELCL